MQVSQLPVDCVIRLSAEGSLNCYNDGTHNCNGQTEAIAANSSNDIDVTAEIV